MIAALAVAGVTAATAEQALGASEPITTPTSCCVFSKPSFTIDQGTVATFQNSDPGFAPHDVTATGTGTNGKPLFASATINVGQVPVNGTETLNSGSYGFFCTIHPIQMTGTLLVSGTAATVGVKVLSKRLKAAVKSGKLKLKLRSTGALRGVSVTARKGKKQLGSKGGISLSAGARTISLRLSRGGRAALKNLKAAKVKVTVTVPGGQPVTAKARLR